MGVGMHISESLTRGAGLIVLAAVVIGCSGSSGPASTPSARPVITSRPPTVAPPAPSATVPALSAGPTPVPAPSGEAAAVIAAFVKEFAQKQPPFHLDMDGDLTILGGPQRATSSVSATGDIAGEDFDGDVDLPGLDTAHVRFVDGVAYARTDVSIWVSFPDFKQTQPLNPFSQLDAGDVAYVGQTRRDGRDLHQLSTTKWVGGPLEGDGLSNLQLLSSRFDMFLTPQGLPIDAILDFSISGRYAGYASQVQIDYHVEYRFSRIGKPVDIVAPL
jgi:hypothetical protein